MPTRFAPPLLDGLTRRERAVVARLGATISLLDGREVVTQGDLGRQFGIVVSGELRVLRDGVEVARLHAGDCFGEISMAVGPSARHNATIEAMGSAEVRIFTRPEFDQLCQDAPAIAARVHLLALRRLAQTAA